MKKYILPFLSVMLFGTASFSQTYNPIAVTGFNVDGIAEGTPAASTTSQALDGSDYILYTQAYGAVYSTGYGIPNSGTIVSGTKTWQMEPFTQDNILYIPSGLTDSLILTTPAAYASLTFLATSTEGPGTNTYTIEFTDGSTATFANQSLNDWFNGANTVLSGIDRAGRGSGTPDFNGFNPNLYAQTLTLACSDQSKLVAAIVIHNVGTNPRTCIFALSGAVPVSFTITNNSPICHGAQGSAFITPIGGFGPYTYNWSSSPAQSGDTARGLLAGAYTVTAQDGFNCPVVIADTLTEPAGTPLTVTSTLDSVCAGTSVTIRASGALSYTWSNGATPDSSITVSPLVTTTYAVTGSVGGGCAGAGSRQIYVYPALHVGITTSPNDSLCAGQSLTLTNSGATSYTWSGSVVSGVSFVPASTASYSVTGTDAHGCADSARLRVVVFPLPAVSIGSFPGDTLCAGTRLTLFGSFANSYQWSGGVNDAIAFTPAGSATYTVTGTDAHGCSNTASVHIVVNTAPAITASASPGDSICRGSSVTLSGGGGSSYTWSGGANNGVAFSPAASAVYTVTGTDANGCTNTASVAITLKICDGIAEQIGDVEMTLYPNPNNGNMKLQTGKAAELMYIQISDIQGRIIYSAEFSHVQAGDIKTISLDKPASGLYLMTVKADHAQTQQKIIVD